jgi:hypothetical protein
MPHVVIISSQCGFIRLEALFDHNNSSDDNEIGTLDCTAFAEFLKQLVLSVHYAKSGLVLEGGTRIDILVVANGYHLEFLQAGKERAIIISTGAVWRLIKGLSMASDLTRSKSSN